ncbi:MAG: undecaprenyl-diphosphate phosphatase [Alphaproteobacteria bacterium]|nr:undecaprenyl-diphosphate phosphatase [Alphaproteobacteria bacterium]
MDIQQILTLSVVQGITEFLPISSSGHLCFIPKLLNWADQGHDMDVALHIGTLFAVLVYFKNDIFLMLKGLPLLAKKESNSGSRLVIHIIVATIPVVIAGFILSSNPVPILRSLKVISITLFMFGILLYIADRKGTKDKKVENLTCKDALIIGAFQVLALIPGTSRSGITMTAARFLGYDRTESARFSMLLAIPAIAGAGLLTAIHIYKEGCPDLTMFALIGVLASFLTGITAIWVMMKWLKKSSFTPFAVYRVFLGVALFAYGYGFI